MKQSIIFKKNRFKNWEPNVSMLPGLLLVLIFVVIPIFYNFYFSITDYDGFNSNVNFIGLDNFKRIFTTEFNITLNAIKNSFIYGICITVIQNFLAVFIAIFLCTKSKFNAFFRSLYFFPQVLGIFIISTIWGLLMNPNFGVMSYLFAQLGLEVNLLGDPDIAIYSIIFVQVWSSLGYAMIIYYTNVKQISAECIEAADIDGASLYQKIKYIIIPLLVPSFTINILLSLIGSLKLFDVIFLMTTGGPIRSTENLPVLIFNEAFSFGRHGYASALNVIQFFIIILLSMVILRIMNKFETD